MDDVEKFDTRQVPLHEALGRRSISARAKPEEEHCNITTRILREPRWNGKIDDIYTNFAILFNVHESPLFFFKKQ